MFHFSELIQLKSEAHKSFIFRNNVLLVYLFFGEFLFQILYHGFFFLFFISDGKEVISDLLL